MISTANLFYRFFSIYFYVATCDQFNTSEVNNIIAFDSKTRQCVLMQEYFLLYKGTEIVRKMPRRLLNCWDSFKSGIAVAHTSKKPTVKPTKAAASKPDKKSIGLPTDILKVTKPLTKGAGLKAVQQALAAPFFYPEKGTENNGVDGYYGPKTADVVKRFQLMHGLVTDGIYGPKTKEENESKNKPLFVKQRRQDLTIFLHVEYEMFTVI